jgi:hypothetical protein
MNRTVSRGSRRSAGVIWKEKEFVFGCIPSKPNELGMFTPCRFQRINKRKLNFGCANSKAHFNSKNIQPCFSSFGRQNTTGSPGKRNRQTVPACACGIFYVAPLTCMGTARFLVSSFIFDFRRHKTNPFDKNIFACYNMECSHFRERNQNT